MTTPTAGIPGYVAATWDIDPGRTRIGFTARHLGVLKVRGHFDTFTARIVTAEDPLQSSATATVELNSVNTGDETRDNDLRSGNFLDIRDYPTMTYRSTGIRRHGEDFIVDGQLTVRGVTQPVSLKFDFAGFAPTPTVAPGSPSPWSARSTASISASASTYRSWAWPATRSTSRLTARQSCARRNSSPTACSIRRPDIPGSRQNVEGKTSRCMPGRT